MKKRQAILKPRVELSWTRQREPRRAVNSRLLMTCICQVTLVGLILQEAYNNEVFVQALRQFPDELGIMMARFLCVIFLHMVMHDEL